MQEPHYVVKFADGQKAVWSLTQMVAEINRDRSDDWEPYTKDDWTEGWTHFINQEELRIVGFHLR